VPHSVWLPGQTHLPTLQISEARQTWPHPPQFFGSVALSTHRGGAPHMICVVDAPHAWHIPAPQLAVLAQTVPHPPQLFGSVFRSTHVVIVPAPHICWVVGHTHALFTQLAPAPHLRPHPPQLFASLVM
jgi:hypothetical protein